MNTNDFLFAIAKRAGELANLPMDSLRLANGYDCSTPGEARGKDRRKNRGTIIEEILAEEFHEESPRDIGE